MVNLLPQEFETPFLTFLFILMRVGAAVFSMPVIGAQSVPRPIRAAIIFWVAVVLSGSYIGVNANATGFVSPPATRIYNGVVDFTLAGIGEFLIGFALGFTFQLLLAAVGLTGELIGKEAGFSAASVFDPITGEDNFLLAQIKVWLATIVFLVIGGPELVFRALADSFQIVAPGEGFTIVSLGEAGYRTFLYNEGRHTALMSIVFIVGVRLALPMIGAMLLVSLAEAFIARTAPQLNIMSVGFAVRMSMALFLLGNLVVYFVTALKPHLLRYTAYTDAFLGWLAPS